MIERYGVEFSDEVTEAQAELWFAFDVAQGGTSLHRASGFLGAFEHLKRAIDLIWNRYEKPLLIWNDWSETILEELINAYHRCGEVVITGPSASWKSTCVACFINAAWMADPLQTKCPVSSTNLGSLRELLWKDVYKFYRTSQCGFGNIVQHPKPKIQTVKGDDSMGIFGVAVKQGDTDEVIEQIKGRHAPKMVVGIDEGPGALQAVVDACINLRTGCEKFLLIMLGNANSYFDQHGRLAEPEQGWNSVTVESEKWKTKRGGICIHLDGHKAPNVVAGYKKYPGMISQEDLDTAARLDGENSPRYWQERRGFWPPEGLADTVLSESMFAKFDCSKEPVWISNFTLGAALDPAYGGDRCVLRFGKCGMIKTDGEPKYAIALDGYKVIPLDVKSKEPPHYQVARQVREECKSRGIEPRWFAMDCSGIGDGTSNIFKREWSTEFMDVKFGGYASDFPVSDINPRPCKEEYANKVSELWFGFRVAVERGQIRGLDLETAKEFCQRKCDYKRYAPRVIVEPKSEMKARGGRSPDLADAAVVLIELFKRRTNELRQNNSTISSSSRWNEFVMKRNLEPEYAVAK